MSDRIDGKGDAGEARVRDMQVGGGAADTLVTEEDLDSAEIGPELEEMSAKV